MTGFKVRQITIVRGSPKQTFKDLLRYHKPHGSIRKLAYLKKKNTLQYRITNFLHCEHPCC